MNRIARASSRVQGQGFDYKEMSAMDMAAIEAVEQAKEEVVMKLRQMEVAFLTEICVELGLVIPPRKAGIKSALVNIIVTYLSSAQVEDSEDGGAQLLEGLNTKLDGKLDTGNSDGSQVKEEESGQQEKDKKGKTQIRNLKENQGDSSHSDTVYRGNPTTGGGREDLGQATGNATRFRADIKLKEFKIHSGTIGGENQLDLEEVLYQVNEGKALGYSIREIVSGVIRATKAGSSLRKYCQSRPDLTFDKLVSQLRSHYGTEDSQEMLEHMRKMKQEPTEKVVDYVHRVMAMRNRILDVNKKEEHDIGEAVVRKACFRTISLGLRRDTIRLQAQQILVDINLDDDEVVEQISQVAALDKKHLQMVHPNEPTTCSLSTGVQSISQVNLPQGTDTLLAKLAQSLSTHGSELAAMRTRLDQMEQRWGNQGTGKGQPAQNRKGIFKMKCADCEQRKLFCTHCARCGMGDHKQKDCPEKN